jgi:glutathione peroxidase
MRITLLVAMLFPLYALSQNSFYNIVVKSIAGRPVSLEEFRGKKVIVFVVSPANLKSGQLRYLDSLQLKNKSVKIVAVPAADFRGANDSLVLEEVKKNATLSMLITTVESVKKSNGSKQNALTSWLTRATSNTHFDLDVTTDNQAYCISESGILFAVLEKGYAASLLNSLITQPDIIQ